MPAAPPKVVPAAGASSSHGEAKLQRVDETAEACEKLESELVELKARYDQYFLGMERFEPAKDRDAFKQRLVKLKSSYIRNTAMRFRMQALYQKYLSFERMWQRIAREIEEGTYKRDLFKARMRGDKRARKADEAKPRDPDKTDPHIVIPGGPADLAARAAAAKPATVSPPPPAAPPVARALVPSAPVARAAGGAGLSEDKVKAIYSAYVAAKRQCKESTEGITYEAVARTLNKQTPELMKQYNAKAVDFKVVIKNGKATLKAVPKT